MEMKRVLICVALMALVTYIPRVVPLTVFRKPIKSKYLRSFLDYTPYAVLGAMTFPDVFTSTGSLISALCGTAAALVLSYRGKGLVTVACAAIAAGTTFVLALVVLQLCSAVYKKRHEQLENEFDKEEKDD